MGSACTAIIPMKRLDQAKSRLAGRLDPFERRELVIRLFSHVLETLNDTPVIDQILVVTSDVEISRLGRVGGATVLGQPDAGVNAAIEYGLGQLRDVGSERFIAIFGDLPYLTSGDIQNVVGLMEPGTLVVAPDRHDRGTNLLAGYRVDAIRPAFGSDSFRVHRGVAVERGLIVREYRSRGTAFDIDTPDDLDNYERLLRSAI